MHSYTACGDEEICEVVRRGYGELVAYAQRVSGADSERIARFFGRGMLLNVLASMNVLDSDEPWAKTILEGCRKALA
jgi:hypothetical protein